jgi:hypothetical protein
MIKSFTTLAVILLPVFILSYLTVWCPKINRHKYSLIASFSVGLQLCILLVMYGARIGIYAGLAALLLAIPGGYPIAYYYLYSKYEERFNKYSRYKS